MNKMTKTGCEKKTCGTYSLARVLQEQEASPGTQHHGRAAGPCSSLRNPQEVKDADVISLFHSGGKDSQAQTAYAIRLGIPKEKIVLIHSDLGEMKWEPMHDWIEKNGFGLPLHIVSSRESFFDLCRRTKRLPSGQCQYCTDVLKITPIATFIHEYMTEYLGK